MPPTTCFLKRDIICLETVSLTLVPCEPDIHGPFIRQLTRENFYDILSCTIGWDEERHQQEPRSPERYRMVQLNDEIIGFFAVRLETDYLYIHTIQLVPAFRDRGYGTALLQYIEGVARLKDLRFLNLSVFEGNPARQLYQRLAYRPIAEREVQSLILMQKEL